MKRSIIFWLRTLLLAFMLSATISSAKANDSKRIDSLHAILQQAKQDTTKVNLLNELSWEMRNNNPQLAEQHASEAYQLATQLQFKKGQAIALCRLALLAYNRGAYLQCINYAQNALEIEIQQNNLYGITRANHYIIMGYQQLGNNSKALEFAFKNLHTWEQLNNAVNLAKTYNLIGSIYRKMGDHEIAMKHFLTCQDIYLKHKDTNGLATTYLNIGTLFELQQDYTNALQNMEKSLELFRTLNNQRQVAHCLNNIGNCNLFLKNYDAARYYYSESKVIKEALEDKVGIAVAHLNLAKVYETEEVFDKAIDECNKSIQICREAQYLQGLADATFTKAKLYQKTAQTLKAIDTLQASLQLANELKYKLLQSQAHQSLSEAYRSLDNYQNAYLHLSQYVILNDSLEKGDKEASRLAHLFEQERSKNKLLQQQVENEQLKNQSRITIIYSLSIGIILLLLLFILIYAYYRQKQNNENQKQHITELLNNKELNSISELLEVQDKERKRIAQDLHDQLGAMLSTVKLYFKSVEDEIKQVEQQIGDVKSLNVQAYQKANQLLDDASQQVRKIAHDMVSGALMKFGLKAALEELRSTIENTGKLHFDLHIFGIDDRLDNQIEINLYRIFQELINNTIKYADAMEVTVQLILKDNNLSVMYEDDGKGFDKNAPDFKPGMGLRNIASRIQKLHGIHNIDSTPGKGTTITMNIPIEKEFDTKFT